MKVNLSNSIYQQKNSGYGLSVKNGMLINNAPDGVMGIRQAVEIKKSMKKAEKIATMSEAVSLGSMKDCMY